MDPNEVRWLEAVNPERGGGMNKKDAEDLLSRYYEAVETILTRGTNSVRNKMLWSLHEEVIAAMILGGEEVANPDPEVVTREYVADHEDRILKLEKRLQEVDLNAKEIGALLRERVERLERANATLELAIGNVEAKGEETLKHLAGLGNAIMADLKQVQVVVNEDDKRLKAVEQGVKDVKSTVDALWEGR